MVCGCCFGALTAALSVGASSSDISDKLERLLSSSSFLAFFRLGAVGTAVLGAFVFLTTLCSTAGALVVGGFVAVTGLGARGLPPTVKPLDIRLMALIAGCFVRGGPVVGVGTVRYEDGEGVALGARGAGTVVELGGGVGEVAGICMVMDDVVLMPITSLRLTSS